jgi:hypothetical protein
MTISNPAHRWWVCAVLLVPLAAPAAACGDAPVAWQRKALAVAARVFHPACGPLSIVFEDAAQAHAGFPEGPASEPQAGQPAEQPAGWARAGECIVHLDRDHRWLGYPEFCHVVLHEAGNVAGYGDDWSNPRSIRYPLPFITKTTARIGGRTVVRWSGVDRRCLPSATHHCARRGLPGSLAARR